MGYKSQVEPTPYLGKLDRHGLETWFTPLVEAFNLLLLILQLIILRVFTNLYLVIHNQHKGEILHVD